ncbi:YcxB family protein [Ruminococcaceae bacterium OttesenSCG-928-D13]|nr:YcxB family protein [Ruminococcaceae bacterium OttesenSCG-928-D13]
MLCRVEMPANEQIFGRFYRYRMMHSGGKGGVIAMPLILGALLVCMLLMNISLIVVGATALLVVGYLVFTFYLKPARQFRSQPGAALKTEVTILNENSITRSVRSEEGGMPDNMSMQYTALHHAVETGRDFYLFTSPTQALLLDKEFFTKGDPADLRKVLQAKLGAKFKTKQRG